MSELPKYGEPEVALEHGRLMWSAIVKVPAAPFRDRGYLGHVTNHCFGFTRRGTERRVERMVRRLHRGKVFVF